METDMMKMKVKKNGLEFEVEVHLDTFLKLMNNLDEEKSTSQKDYKKTDKELVNNPENLVGSDYYKEAVQSQNTDLPPVPEDFSQYNDLGLKERDWVLLCCYYASEKGHKQFTRKSVRLFYEQTGRATDSRLSHIKDQLKAFISYRFITSNQVTGLLKLNKEGIEYIEALLQGNKTAKERIRSSIRTQPRSDKANRAAHSRKKTVRTHSIDTSLNLRPVGKDSLKEFCNKYDITSIPKAVVVIIFYLKETLRLEKVDKHVVYTCMDELKIKNGISASQALYATKYRKGWVDYQTLDDVDLSIKGRNAVLYDLPKARHRIS